KERIVGLFTELGNLVANVSSPIEVTSSRWVSGCAATHYYALMISPRLVMKRLQPNCPAQRTSQRPSTLPELPTFSSIETGENLMCHASNPMDIAGDTVGGVRKLRSVTRPLKIDEAELRTQFFLLMFGIVEPTRHSKFRIGNLNKEALVYTDFGEYALICKLIWFFERLTWNPAESLARDVSKQPNVLH
ncbi:hypothetical protein T265_15499, partial [Opisthorchis viverrini]